MNPIVCFIVGAIFGWVMVPLHMSRRDHWRTSPYAYFTGRIKCALLFGVLAALFGAGAFK